MAHPKLKMLEAFSDVVEITGKTAGKESWDDESTIAMPSYKLSVLSDADAVREVKIFLTGLFVRSSPRAIAAALIMTWNMRSVDPVAVRIFPAKDKGKDTADVDVKNLEVAGVDYIDAMVETNVKDVSDIEIIRAGAFIAASTLKMFAKSFTGWTQAWEHKHIQKRYADFCKTEYPFKEFTTNTKCAETMYEAYQGQKLYQGILGRILFRLGNVQDPRQIKMLFDQHLANTGMHIIPQFTNAQLSIGATTAGLLSALNYGQNFGTLMQLKKLINESLSKPPGPDNRATWRFARIFDPSVFQTLQTKYCADTVAILANINSMGKLSTETSNPLNIAVLKQMAPERKRYTRQVAKNIYHHFMVVARALNNDMFDTDKYKFVESDDEEEHVADEGETPVKE
uniref:Nucleoprotein n=1 Tax=Varicosavirus lactucae TaxID=1985698 RepID=Q5EN72_9RHAB|nr:coat protein [Varicosavirus lactucae]